VRDLTNHRKRMDQLRTILVEAWMRYDREAIVLADAEIRQLLPLLEGEVVPKHKFLPAAKRMRPRMPHLKKPPIPPELIMAAVTMAAEVCDCDPFSILGGELRDPPVTRARIYAAKALYDVCDCSRNSAASAVGVFNVNSADVYLANFERNLRLGHVNWYNEDVLELVRAAIRSEIEDGKIQRMS